MSRPQQSTADFEAILVGEAAPPHLALRLYVAGSSARSTRAIQNAKEICETHCKDRYTLEVIDIFQQPALAREDAVLAVPVVLAGTWISVRARERWGDVAGLASMAFVACLVSPYSWSHHFIWFVVPALLLGGVGPTPTTTR